MVTVAREIERKYEPTSGAKAGASPRGKLRAVPDAPPAAPAPAGRVAADPVALPDLAGLPGVASVEPVPPVALDAVYFDTPGLRLAAAGVTLRLRTGHGPDEDGWQLKLPGAETDGRDEIRAAAAPGELAFAAEAGAAPPLPPLPPEELARLVRARVRDQALLPVARIRTARSRTRLLDRAGRPLAEIALDRVSGRPLGPSDPTTLSGTATEPLTWTEIEVELAERTPARDGVRLLDAVEQRLTAAGLRRSDAPSKLARTLGGRPGAAPTADGKKGSTKGPRKPAKPTAADAVLAHLAAHTERLLALDPEVRRGRPDAVHRMRVAARRLRSTLRAYRKVLDPAATDALVADLRLLGAELGAERDQEVLAARLRKGAAGLPTDLLLGPVRARLRAWEVAQAEDGRRRTLDLLDSPRYLAMLDRLDALLVRPPLTGTAGKPAAKVLRSALEREHRRVGARYRKALAAAPAARDAALHDVRKAAKRARYAAEAAEPVLGKPARRYRKAMKGVQQLLGEQHDTVTARRTLRTLGVQAHLAGENGFSYGLLHAAEAARAARAEHELPEAMARVGKAARNAVS